VFFLFDNSSQTSDSLLFNTIPFLIKSFELLNSSDKINIGFFNSSDTANLSPRFYSPVFSSNRIFFQQNLTEFLIEKPTKYFPVKLDFSQKIQNTLEFIENQELNTQKNMLFILIGKLNQADFSTINKNIEFAKKNNISIYCISSNDNNLEYENNFASLASQTGGIYIKSKQKLLVQNLKKCLDDATLSEPKKVYALTFEANQNEKINNYELIYKNKVQTKINPNPEIKDKTTPGELLIYLFLLITNFLFLFFYLFERRKRKVNKKQITEQNNKQKNENNSFKNHILIVNNGDFIKPYQLTSPEITIGRDINNNLIISDSSVSSFHALIFLSESNYYIKDLESTNGVYVNNKQIHESILKSGDSIKVGTTIIQYKN